MTGWACNREEAAALFLDMLLVKARDRGIDSARSLLEQGPTGRGKPKDLVALHEWYANLRDEDRKFVQEAIREATESAVFGVLVLLDGCTGGLVRDGVAIQFALTLELRDAAVQEQAPADVAIRLNPMGVAAEYLHDMYWQALARRSASGQ